MAMTVFKQCRLEKKGREDKVAFLPRQYAQKGKILKLKDVDGWDNGWTVSGVSNKEVPQNRLPHEHTHWRARNDV